MSVRISLARGGYKHHPIYRVVVQDGASARNGRFIEWVGTFNPHLESEGVKLKLDRIDYWMSKGALPTNTAGQLIKKYRKANPPADAGVQA